MGLTACKDKCREFEKASKPTAYQEGGCYCNNCDYYFKEKFLRCPCCNTRTRFSNRTNRARRELEVVRM